LNEFFTIAKQFRDGIVLRPGTDKAIPRNLFHATTPQK